MLWQMNQCEELCKGDIMLMSECMANQQSFYQKFSDDSIPEGLHSYVILDPTDLSMFYLD